MIGRRAMMIVWSALHPPNWVSTVVIDSRTAQPLTLADLFANEQDGEPAIRTGQDPSPGGQRRPRHIAVRNRNDSLDQNFANWIPTDDGMRIHFDEYHFGGPPFAQVITVPWSALSDVLAPDMIPLAQG